MWKCTKCDRIALVSLLKEVLVKENKYYGLDDRYLEDERGSDTIHSEEYDVLDAIPCCSSCHSPAKWEDEYDEI
jgi:hypothetical protein